MAGANTSTIGNTKNIQLQVGWGILALITSLFFLWAFIGNMNDILMPHLKEALQLSDTQSSWVQVVYFGTYFVMAIPAGYIIKKAGYKIGIVSGLSMCCIGALLFYPAAELNTYAMFLLALWVLASGAATLEVAANPYMAMLGKPEKASFRLNLAQSFNMLGAVLAPEVGRAFILQETHTSINNNAAMLQGPYLVIAGMFALIALLCTFVKLPEPYKNKEEKAIAQSSSSFIDWQILKDKTVLFGVITLFFYVGAQVGIGSYIIRYEAQYHEMSLQEGARIVTYHLLGCMIGRFACSALMLLIKPSKVLLSLALLSILCCGLLFFPNLPLSVWAFIGIGFGHSIMFPTIFSLTVANLGEKAKDASTLLVMAIVGGAIYPYFMGLLSDGFQLKTAFILPLAAYVLIAIFAIQKTYSKN